MVAGVTTAVTVLGSAGCVTVVVCGGDVTVSCPTVLEAPPVVLPGDVEVLVVVEPAGSVLDVVVAAT